MAKIVDASVILYISLTDDFMSDLLNRLSNDRPKLINNFGLILVTTFTVFIFAPLEMYVTKIKYVWYSIYDFGPYIYK